jgi:hypothetical protein
MTQMSARELFHQHLPRGQPRSRAQLARRQFAQAPAKEHDDPGFQIALRPRQPPPLTRHVPHEQRVPCAMHGHSHQQRLSIGRHALIRDASTTFFPRVNLKPAHPGRKQQLHRSERCNSRSSRQHVLRHRTACAPSHSTAWARQERGAQAASVGTHWPSCPLGVARPTKLRARSSSGTETLACARQMARTASGKLPVAGVLSGKHRT